MNFYCLYQTKGDGGELLYREHYQANATQIFFNIKVEKKERKKKEEVLLRPRCLPTFTRERLNKNMHP